MLRVIRRRAYFICISNAFFGKWPQGCRSILLLWLGDVKDKMN